MKVRELIDLLKTFNPDYEVYGPCPDGFGFVREYMDPSLFSQNDEDKNVEISAYHPFKDDL